MFISIILIIIFGIIIICYVENYKLNKYFSDDWFNVYCEDCKFSRKYIYTYDANSAEINCLHKNHSGKLSTETQCLVINRKYDCKDYERIWWKLWVKS